MNLRRLKVTTFLSGALLVAACVRFHAVTPPPQDPMPRSVALENAALRMVQLQRPPCLEMVKTFCKSLYAPGNEGTMEMMLPGGALNIRRGRTENDFSQVYFEYAETQIRFKDRLPKDFLWELNQQHYFRKLRTYLSHKPRETMSLEERTSVIGLAHEIDALWNASLDETALKRMEKKYHGFSRLQEDLIPEDLRYENRRVHSILISEVAKAVWAEHPNWKQVVAQFQEVKQAYLDIIAEHPDIPAEVKKDWLERINSATLIVPGSDPEVDMLACARTEDNAYYYTRRNYLTVCAGDFNSEQVRHTLAHELGHSLDVSRSLNLFESQSTLGQHLGDLRREGCSLRNFSCSDWTQLKNRFPEYLKELEKFHVQLPSFQSCLKGKKTNGPIPDDYLTRVAREEAEATISGLAERNAFLRVMSPELPMPNGKTHKNLMYFNPCGWYLWDSSADLFDGELSSLLFFTSEYRCTEDLAESDRFKGAMDKALDMQSALVLARMKAEGEFSSRPRLNTDNYASSPTERFADAMAGLVFARLLEKEKDLPRRRGLYLANNAWLCQKPSLQQWLPIEAGIQKKFYVEAHSEDSLRQKELLPEEIRRSLQCDQDFEIEECRL
jgi:hypothetical protein